jgi:hypothetical protein
MTQTLAPQPVAPPEADHSRQPADSVPSAPESILEPVSPSTRAPQEIPEWGDSRHYAQHWGINE